MPTLKYTVNILLLLHCSGGLVVKDLAKHLTSGHSMGTGPVINMLLVNLDMKASDK